MVESKHFSSTKLCCPLELGLYLGDGYDLPMRDSECGARKAYASCCMMQHEAYNDICLCNIMLDTQRPQAAQPELSLYPGSPF